MTLFAAGIDAIGAYIRFRRQRRFRSPTSGSQVSAGPHKRRPARWAGQRAFAERPDVQQLAAVSATAAVARYTSLMAGIVFLRTAKFDKVRAFYTEEVGMTVWLEQHGIAILRHGNLLIGFHRQPEADLDGLITFFYETRDEVDQAYVRLRDVALAEPRENPKYKIYHFFGVDPEGRKIEFQQFLHPVPEIPGTGAATTSSA